MPSKRLNRLRAPSVVLHYHNLGSVPRVQDPHNLTVSVSAFERQLASLRRRGYEFVTASEFAARLTSEGPPPGLCSLTFDDGTPDNLEVLPEMLARHEARATVFVCPGLLGRPHSGFPPDAGIRLMDAGEVLELASLGSVEVGSHTNLHTSLDEANEEFAYREMASSKIALEELLDRPVTGFAYPSCGYSPACPGAARRAGYSVAVTCAFRGSWAPHELQRESVTALDGRLAFELKSRRLWTPLHHSWLGGLGARFRWRHSVPPPASQR